MENKESFVSNEKYNCLADGVKLNLWELDAKLSNLNYCYNGVWRNDKENGGNIVRESPKKKKCKEFN